MHSIGRYTQGGINIFFFLCKIREERKKIWYLPSVFRSTIWSPSLCACQTNIYSVLVTADRLYLPSGCLLFSSIFLCWPSYLRSFTRPQVPGCHIFLLCHSCSLSAVPLRPNTSSSQCFCSNFLHIASPPLRASGAIFRSSLCLLLFQRHQSGGNRTSVASLEDTDSYHYSISAPI